MYYPNSNQEMPTYSQFQNVHLVKNPNVLKWWINSGQVTIDQLSSEQRITLKIVEPFQQKFLNFPKPEDCAIGEVYSK